MKQFDDERNAIAGMGPMNYSENYSQTEMSFKLWEMILSMAKHGFCWSMATNLKELIMPIKKGSAAGDKGGKRGTSAPSNKHAQEKMKSGNPTPGAESSKRASQTGRASKKGSK